SAPDVAVALLEHEGLEVVALGGPVHPETRTVVGAEAVDALRAIRADLCILGACSLHADAGVTVLHREEAIVERVMLERAARVAAVSDRLDLRPGTLGVALACIAAGSLLAMPVAGWASARWGSRRTTRAALAAFTLSSGVVALAPSLLALCALCLALGASAGSLDVAMNAHGVALERRLGHPILSSLHAAFSLGGLAGAG